jgi:hypothetical protein
MLALRVDADAVFEQLRDDDAYAPMVGGVTSPAPRTVGPQEIRAVAASIAGVGTTPLASHLVT